MTKAMTPPNAAPATAAPIVSITTPINNTAFLSPANIPITAAIIDEHKWDAFWDAPLNLGPAGRGGNPPPAEGVANQPGTPRKADEIVRASASYEVKACEVKTNGGRLEVTFPGVRLGWATAPAEVVTRLVSAKQTTDQCAGAFGQRLFEEFHRRGWIDEQLERSRALYERKSQRLLAALQRSMPERAHWTTPRGGFFSWLTVPGVDTTDLAQRAVGRNVGIVPGSLFFPDGRGGESARLSFSLVDEAQIDEGVERLAALLQ